VIEQVNVAAVPVLLKIDIASPAANTASGITMLPLVPILINLPTSDATNVYALVLSAPDCGTLI
jgi:hypothetical protein